MNVTLLDALPLVAQWYYEKQPRDSFFALQYMNAPVYASRFADADRERIGASSLPGWTITGTSWT